MKKHLLLAVLFLVCLCILTQSYICQGETQSAVSISKSPDGLVWTVTFHTDELVRVIENFPIGQKFQITGYVQGELKWPHIKDPTKIIALPIPGAIFTNAEPSLKDLDLKYKKGGVITITFFEKAPTSLSSNRAAADSLAERTKPQYEKGDVSVFDIQGIKLGMSIEEVKRVKPAMNISEYQRDQLLKFTGCDGAGCGMSADWNLTIDGTAAPYGSGVFRIRLQNLLFQVDMPTYIKTLRANLIQKYGLPTFDINFVFEKNGPVKKYHAFWGNTEDVNKVVSKNKLPLQDYSLLRFKCLIVDVDGWQPTMTLLDPAPLTIAKQKEKEEMIKKSEKVMKF